MFNYKIMENFLAKPDESLASHTKNLIENLDTLKKFGYIKDDYIYSWSRKACYYHDMGKINSEFQNRIKSGKRFNLNKEVGHNLLSAILIGLEYEGYLETSLSGNKIDYSILMSSVLDHHNYVDSSELLDNKRGVIQKNLESILEALCIEDEYALEDILYFYEMESSDIRGNIKYPQNLEEYKKHHQKYKMISGLLKKCDYSASGHLPIEFKNDFLEASLDKIAERFEYGWNEMQQYCKENQNKNLVIKGSTGLGKTEASLLWAGDNKIFYILPLKTAINSMHKRIKMDLLKNKDVEKRLALLHGNTLSDYFEDSELNEREDSNFERIMNYYSLTKNFALPISISTPDQIFKFVYNYFGSEVPLVTLSYSKIIIDEIQSYSADILCYLIYGLQEAVKMGAKYAIITATLPPFAKDLLVKGKDNEDLSEVMKYEEREFVNDVDRHNLCVLDKELNTEDIYEKFRESLSEDDSSKFLVVCNTIKKAQEIFGLLKEKLEGYEDVEVNLLHSKFTGNDRTEKENRILEDGKTETKKRVIWVSTQVVEASLDIDFDYLFTELSDLNSLFQRLGRVNRKGKKSVDDYNCYVYTEIDKVHLKYEEKIDHGAYSGFIDGAIYEISRDVLLDLGNGIISEVKKIELINENFTTEKLKEKNGVFLKDYEAFSNYVRDLAYDEVQKHEAEDRFRNIISYNIIPESLFNEDDNLRNLIKELENIDAEYERIKSSAIDSESRSSSYENLYQRKIETVRAIRKYTVPVAHYNIDKEDRRIENQIKLSKYETVYRIYCDYSEELGFNETNKKDKNRYKSKKKFKDDDTERESDDNDIFY